MSSMLGVPALIAVNTFMTLTSTLKRKQHVVSCTIVPPTKYRKGPQQVLTLSTSPTLLSTTSGPTHPPPFPPKKNNISVTDNFKMASPLLLVKEKVGGTDRFPVTKESKVQPWILTKQI
jgi:hypothetical protein